MAGSSVEGCLKHFFAAEKLDDYFCSHCWHIAAVKYLSITNEYKVINNKLNNSLSYIYCGQDLPSVVEFSCPLLVKLVPLRSNYIPSNKCQEFLVIFLIWRFLFYLFYVPFLSGRRCESEEL